MCIFTPLHRNYTLGPLKRQTLVFLMNFTLNAITYMRRLYNVPAVNPRVYTRGYLKVFKGQQKLEEEPRSCKEKLRKEQRRTADLP